MKLNYKFEVKVLELFITEEDINKAIEDYKNDIIKNHKAYLFCKLDKKENKIKEAKLYVGNGIQKVKDTWGIPLTGDSEIKIEQIRGEKENKIFISLVL